LPQVFIAIGVFLTTHVALAENPLRGVLVRRLGERPFVWSYGILAILQLLWVHQAVDAAPVVQLWQPPRWIGAIPLAVMPLAILLLVCGFTQSNPTATLAKTVAAGRLARREVRGVLSITRNPVMWGLGLLFLAQLAIAAELAEALRCGAYAALALLFLPRIEAKQRAKWGDAAWADFTARSSSVPFVAMMQGRARFDWREIGGVRLITTAGLYLAFAWLTAR
jgi:uncharacterized membrane protein